MMTIDWTIQLNEENGVGNGTVPVREEIEFDQRYAEEKKNTMAGCGHKLQKRKGKEAERCSGPKGRGRIVLDPTGRHQDEPRKAVLRDDVPVDGDTRPRGARGALHQDTGSCRAPLEEDCGQVSSSPQGGVGPVSQ